MYTAIAYGNDNLYLGTIPNVDYKIAETNGDNTIIIKESGSSNINVVLDEFGDVCFIVKKADIYFTANIFAVLDILTQLDVIEPGSYRNVLLDDNGLTFQVGVSSAKKDNVMMYISNQNISLILNIETPKQFQSLEEIETNIRALFK
jgi:GTP:adenosylcobinamide-phosphate guanylyltransferase